MFLSMAAMALTTYALLALHTPLPTVSTPLAIEECSEEARSEVWNSLPECRPRPTLITLPLPRDPSILQVIPSQVEVEQCAGTCHLPGEAQYQRCVAGHTKNISVPVLYEKLVPGSGVEEICASVTVSAHLNCSCGCPPAQCGPNQIFEDRTCECRCRDQGNRGQCLVQYNKEWDSSACSCRCRAEEFKECSTGFRYEGVYSCECLPVGTISASTPMIVALGVVVIALILLCIVFFIQFRKMKAHLLKVEAAGQAERLFPSHGEGL